MNPSPAIASLVAEYSLRLWDAIAICVFLSMHVFSCVFLLAVSFPFEWNLELWC